MRFACSFIATLSLGCATAPETFGTSARFSPAFQGYVMSVHDGSDDPPAGEPVLVLRDPLTGDKLRCAEDVERWRELHEDVAQDYVADENAAVTAIAVTAAVFGPLVAVQPLGALVAVEAMVSADLLYTELASADPLELLGAAMALQERGRFAQSIPLVERALARDASLGVLYGAYLLLGRAYRAVGREDDARTAFKLFLTRAAVRDVAAFREAEAALVELGVTFEPCESAAPVELKW